MAKDAISREQAERRVKARIRKMVPAADPDGFARAGRWIDGHYGPVEDPDDWAREWEGLPGAPPRPGTADYEPRDLATRLMGLAADLERRVDDPDGTATLFPFARAGCPDLDLLVPLVGALLLDEHEPDRLAGLTELATVPFWERMPADRGYDWWVDHAGLALDSLAERVGWRTEANSGGSDGKDKGPFQPSRPVSLTYAARGWYKMDRRCLQELIDSGSVWAEKLSERKWQFHLPNVPEAGRDDARGIKH